MTLSVRLMSYNHSAYIDAALHSINIQKTNFEFEIVIGDDFSLDDTLEKIKNFKFTNPNIKVNILERVLGDEYSIQRQNRGRLYNFIDIIANCQGKYIALLDGDDYWTDPLKLQKQVDFLDANSDYVMCTHVTEEKNEIMNTSVVFPKIENDTTKHIEDYIINNLTATCSLMFKAEYLDPMPDWFNKIKFGDLGLMLMFFYRSNKKMMVLKNCMAVYRINSGSIHGSLKKNKASLIKAYKMHLDFIDTINNELFLKKDFQKNVIRKKIDTHSILADLYKNTSFINYCKHLFIRILLTRFKC